MPTTVELLHVMLDIIIYFNWLAYGRSEQAEELRTTPLLIDTKSKWFSGDDFFKYDTQNVMLMTKVSILLDSPE